MNKKKPIRVITYGTYDFLHHGHIRLLKRAKALGDYLIVGITSDDYDKSRGKINVQQPLMERIEAVKSTGIPDEIIVEEYEGQKIDDIRRHDVDIFTVGSDWTGKFDYLKEYCKVVYLDRTEGVSSSEIRTSEHKIRLGLVGGKESNILAKYVAESKVVNGIELVGIFAETDTLTPSIAHLQRFESYDQLLGASDAVYIISNPADHYRQIKHALENGKHVICESPIAIKASHISELFDLAKNNNLVLMDAIKTAYATAYDRLMLIAKGGKIGKIVSVDATCTSIREVSSSDIPTAWNSICGWGPTAMLPIFQLMGVDYTSHHISSYFLDGNGLYDLFTHITFQYEKGVATVKVGRGVKSEGELIISGTKGYIYVPAPWWKTDYFEIRYENSSENKRYFYQLEGEGIRYELVAFIKATESKRNYSYIDNDISVNIGKVIEEFYDKKNLNTIT
ncbi:MAG TPA: glycerol-3-phosphate cytidylyltransferase [Lachnospiraceae bacterium]|nr:glycerol-3-phosphate cytidylyltransferase [Lachnospiraceae bacterium]